MALPQIYQENGYIKTWTYEKKMSRPWAQEEKRDNGQVLNQEAESKATKDFINYEYICKFHKVV